ncbi:hypothetical protein QNJ24_10265 [Macrococcus caseolyticus]|uniref:hypothetical protein n=1 Tax=Macrococcoides caseolyticum TaxID=69966 RepID=UPI0024BCA1A3|nr:hypothetical protein [Macrococcus caseolyticus]MDJ1156451.1 hypothetical protein [Macrococcus caseolyticus]
MAKYSFKEQMKIGAKTGDYLKTLDKDQKKYFKSLSQAEKDDIIFSFINGEEVELVVPEGDYKTEVFLKKHGVFNPTTTTLNAIEPLVLNSKLNSFANNWASITTLSVDKQAIMNSNIIMQEQNYALIAQQDEIIKQNNEIIRLLKEISQK